jgi:glycosyltransferase involved in cell wall biosynthesis
MVTTSYGAPSSGGAAAYVDRLAGALARRGHEVHVFHCAGSAAEPSLAAAGVEVHAMETGRSRLARLALRATGLSAFQAEELRAIGDARDLDVVHFHDIALAGGPAVLRLGRYATRFMTAHDHWLICPMHLLWKFGRRRCDGAACARCCLAAGKPPQLWRGTGALPRALQQLDALIFPSRHALEEHRRRGIGVPMVHLPYFLPDDWSGGIEDEEPRPAPNGRPYVAAAGALEARNGFQRLIPLMRFLPEVDLRLAGDGPFEPRLRELAAGLPNVHFEGRLDAERRARLFHGARAVIAPSLFPETFGEVVLEAFAVGTPVVVHEGGGALAETGVASGGGLGYQTDAELLLALRRIVHDDDLRAELAHQGYAARTGEWSEAAHIDRYLALVRGARSSRCATLSFGRTPQARQPA